MKAWSLSAIVVSGALAASAAAQPQPPTPTFHALSYDVSLTPAFGTGVLTGVERLRFESLQDGLDTLSFTANPMAINATLDGAPGVTTSVVDGRLLVHLPRRLRRGEAATLVMSFAGRPKRDGEFTAELIHTGYFTCEVMVCDVDRPGDRAPLSVSLTLPAGMDAVAPGRLVSRTVLGDGRELWRWREDRPYGAYLYGFAAGRYAREALDGASGLSVLYTGQTPERVRAMFGDTAHMVAFYQSKAGLPLPEGRYTQVLVDDHGDQEDAALSMIEKGSVEPILADPRKDGLVAHELAHQWWGNLITCADWKELWLNEGLTSFMVAAWKEQRWGRAAYDRQIAAGVADWEAAKRDGWDRPLSFQGTYPSLRFKRRMAYGKSVAFLDRLRTELGDDAFWRGLRRYTRTNAGRSVTAIDLERAFEAESGRDLSGLFKTWVFG